jgi:4-alpha-glucanotransferase
MRKAGVLLPVSALPSDYGIGEFGNSAYQFIDLLHQMNITIWQVLPINPLGYGNSPYQAYSSFAGEELYISIDSLIQDGLLDYVAPINPTANTIDYEKVRSYKQKCLKQAFINFKATKLLLNEYQDFINNTSWLKNYAVFITLKKINYLQPWSSWPNAHKNWIHDKKLDLTPFETQIEYEMFIQFIFYRQWFQLKDYANKLGILIMGDIPIYAGFDSLDVWENQDIFLLDKNQQPTFVAGVPPDYFSPTGQRWGNPLYDWQKLEESNFDFWIKRIDGNTKTFDIIRIDHFRAFDTYWKIPVSCETAIEGEWVEAPGYALLDTIYKKLPNINIVAEDLGDLRPEVFLLRDHYNLKGMQIFQFKFDSSGDNSELEDSTNTILYTGTHDNSTLMGWYQSLDTRAQELINKYFGATIDSIKNKILHYLLHTEAEYVIIPVQDIIGLDDIARINTPSTIGSPNWEWKLVNFDALQQEIDFIRHEVISSRR